MANTLDGLGHVLLRQGKLNEAEAMLREALAMRSKLLGTSILWLN